MDDILRQFVVKFMAISLIANVVVKKKKRRA